MAAVVTVTKLPGALVRLRSSDCFESARAGITAANLCGFRGTKGPHLRVLTSGAERSSGRGGQWSVTRTATRSFSVPKIADVVYLFRKRFLGWG